MSRKRLPVWRTLIVMAMDIAMIGAGLFFVMATWSRGSGLIRRKLERDTPLLEDMLPYLASRSVYRAPGAAIFLTTDPTRVPGALLHNLKHNRVLHERNLIVSVRTDQAPHVDEAHRAEVTRLSLNVQASAIWASVWPRRLAMASSWRARSRFCGVSNA